MTSRLLLHSLSVARKIHILAKDEAILDLSPILHLPSRFLLFLLTSSELAKV
jgi:hypothetical protein